MQTALDRLMRDKDGRPILQRVHMRHEPVTKDGTRLRALGLDAGARVAIAHRGVFGGRDPLAVMIGRMTVAVRRFHAAAMEIEPL